MKFARASMPCFPTWLVWAVLRIGHGVALGNKFVWEETIRDPQITQVSGRGKCQQARYRALLPNRPTAIEILGGGVKHRRKSHFTDDLSSGLIRLNERNRHDRGVRNGLNKAETKSAQRR
jgi:hypothetical protein